MKQDIRKYRELERTDIISYLIALFKSKMIKTICGFFLSIIIIIVDDAIFVYSRIMRSRTSIMHLLLTIVGVKVHGHSWPTTRQLCRS